MDIKAYLQITALGNSGPVGIKEKMIVGRATPGNPVDLNLPAPFVSRRHGEMGRDPMGIYYMDVGSTNGTYYNGQRLPIGKKQYLHNGDLLEFKKNPDSIGADRITAAYHAEEPGQPGRPQAFKEPRVLTGPLQFRPNAVPGQQMAFSGSPLEIHIEERSVSQHGKKIVLLQNIHMTIQPGEMALILGGSGAGKTTFMNAVMGYEKAQGRILHGNQDIYQEFETMKYQIGFVPQQDLLRGSDTVYDTLSNAADMKLPSSVKKQRREERIAQVLETLGLQREKDSLVSKLSGGQRKRLSIAVEYIADPSLFFLDEPDSGLDGIMSRSLMQNLRGIADEGKIVMVISHGPDRTPEYFNKVIVLAKSQVDNCGHLAFFGTVSEAHSFFDTHSLEGVVQRINREDEGGDGQSDFYIQKYAKYAEQRYHQSF